MSFEGTVESWGELLKVPVEGIKFNQEEFPIVVGRQGYVFKSNRPYLALQTDNAKSLGIRESSTQKLPEKPLLPFPLVG